MSAPIVNIGTAIRQLVTGGISASGTVGFTNATATAIILSNYSRVAGTNVFRFTLTNTTNFTGQALQVAFCHTMQNPVRVGLEDVSGNHRLWQTNTPGGPSSATAPSAGIVYQYLIDTALGSFVDTGPFDITQVRRIRFEINSPESGFSFMGMALVGIPRAVPLSQIALTGGSVGNLASIGNIASSVLPFPPGGTADPLAAGFSRYLRLPGNLRIGDGVAGNSAVDLGSGAIQFAQVRSSLGQSWLLKSIPHQLQIDLEDPATISLQIDGGIDRFNLVESSGVSHRYNLIAQNYEALDFGQSAFSGIYSAGGTIVGGNVDSVEITGASGGTAYTPSAASTLGRLLLSNCTSQFGIDLSAKAGTLDLTGLALSGNSFGTNAIRYNSAANLTLIVAPDSGIATGAGASDFGQASVSGGGTLTIQVPVTQITLTGIPTVPGALVGVINLSTQAQTFPAVVNGQATIPTDPAANYLIAVDAPGYQLQRVVLSGGTPSFEVSLENNRDLYEAGTDISANLLFDYETFEVTFIWAEGVVFNNANIYRTIEDYLATPQGVFFPNPPRPIRVPGRNFLFFPFDQAANQVNPVRVRPHAANQGNPRITDVVVILEGSPNPQTDIFDFSLAGGRTIFYQTDATVAIVSGDGGGLGPEDIARLERIENQLIADEIKGASRYQRLLPGTQTVILDKDVTFDPLEGFTITQHDADS